MALQEFFLWGDGGRRMTPEEIARERMLAAAQKPKTGPVGHWSQGAARVVDALAGSLRESQLKEAAKTNAEEDKSAFGDLAALVVAPPQAASAYGDASPAAYGAVSPASAPAAPVGGSPAPDDIKAGIAATAQALGIDPVDLATAISYETAGTFNPTIAGPRTQWGQHRGLIQFGETQAEKYGVDWNNPVGSQLGPDGAIARYLRDAGVQPGMGLMDVYSAINAGGIGQQNASDAANGGTPGTVADKVNQQMAGHREKALAMFGQPSPAPVRVASSDPNDYSAVTQALAQGQQSAPPSPVATALAQSGQRARGAAIPPATDGDVADVTQALARSQPPAPSGGMQIHPAILKALSNPYISREARALAGSMLQQQMQAQQQANDPLRRLQLERAELENEALRNPQPKSTDDMREYEFARSQGYQRTFTQWQQEMRRAGATNVNVGGMEKGFDKTVGEGYGKRFLGLQEEAQTAQRALNALDVMEQSLNDPNFYSGFGAERTLQLKRLGEAMGLDPKGITSMETFNSMTKQAALETMGGSLGTGFSNADRDFVIDQVPNSGNTPEGNRRLVGIQRKLNQRKQEIAQIARGYAAENDGRIDAGFDDYLAKWAEQNPLFPKRVQSKADFNALPSGAEFIAPDGSVRRKP